MSKFKVGDKVTAGNKYDGAWKNLKVIKIFDEGVARIRAIREDEVTGLFSEDELEFDGLQMLSDQELADKVRKTREEFAETYNELINRGYTCYTDKGAEFAKTTVTPFGRIAKNTTIEL